MIAMVQCSLRLQGMSAAQRQVTHTVANNAVPHVLLAVLLTK